MAFRSSTGFAQGSGNSLAIDVPAGAAADDIAVVGIYKENDRAVTPPAEFTQKAALTTSATAQGSLYVFWKRLTATDTGTYTFTWGGPGVWRSAACALFSGRTTTGDPFDGTVGTAESTTTVTTLNVSTSPAAADGDVIDFHTDFQGGNAWTAPTDYTERQDLDVIGMFTRDAVASGSTGNVTATANVSGFMKAFLGVIALAAAGGSVTGTAAGAYGFTGTAAGVPRTSGAATGSYGFTGTAQGVVSGAVLGTAQGSYGFTGIANGTRHVAGSASGSYSFDGAASGIVSGAITGTAEGDYGYDGTADGVSLTIGQADGSYGFNGTATGFTGTPPTTGTASGTYGFTGTAIGDVTVSGSAQTTSSFTGTAIGDVTVFGQAAGNYGITATALGIVPTEDPSPLLITYTEPSSRVTYREQSGIVYQEA